ncbi:MAG: sugar-binding domain-containing protein [Bacteroidota bacterium]
MTRSTILLSLFCFGISFSLFAQQIPLPEHPRPDFHRPQWQNLNGQWNFQFDPDNEGLAAHWEIEPSFGERINVPFPWGSSLSGQSDKADIAWYHREITIDESWQNQRTFLTIGASDWQTTVWVDGKLLGTHEGGYTPFSFELTNDLRYGEKQDLVIRVDDVRRDFTLYGKQGYGNARGIWQTVYLEARGREYVHSLHFLPDIDEESVAVEVVLSGPASPNAQLQLQISGQEKMSLALPEGRDRYRTQIPISDMHLWSLEDPYLYEVQAIYGKDSLQTYFGMRKISVVSLPGTEYPYIALNDQPIYLQLALDQSYHPEGFYTFPSDQFMREEIERSKAIGLNGIRIHIKVEVPRKLYWADKLGLLVMADLPNSWGEPGPRMQAESEYTLRQMIERDYNHPSIFSWIVFNETWGLITNLKNNGKKVRRYLPRTQNWVASMYYLTKSLDPTRLVEDNSICCGAGHTETDINSWHVYLPGWEWDTFLQDLSDNTYPGSTHHFENGFVQGSQPNINSECGNVWGYDGSTGDVDWSWDYHRMMNSFRMYPKIGGWLYTEHHDVINEWNGYWRFDRSEKETGMGGIVPNMDLNDLHSPVYLSTGNEICRTVKGGEMLMVPIHLSVMSGVDYGSELLLEYEVEHLNYIGETEKNLSGSRRIPYEAWMQESLDPLALMLPNISGLATVRIWIKDEAGEVLHRNFMHLEVEGSQMLTDIETISVAPADFLSADFSQKQWSVRQGRKINGAGEGSIRYRLDLAASQNASRPKQAYLIMELSAKELFDKDKEDGFEKGQDYMKGAKVSPSRNPNAYPMSDDQMFPSEVSIWVNGQKLHTQSLSDDPADHRGVLSWHHQLQDRTLREAGSYGYLVKVPISRKVLKQAVKTGRLEFEIRTEGEGGVAVYGKEFGRYPFDPSLVIRY